MSSKRTISVRINPQKSNRILITGDLGDEPKTIGARQTKTGAWELPAVNASLYALTRLYGASTILHLDPPTRIQLTQSWASPIDLGRYAGLLYPWQKEALENLVPSPMPGCLIGFSPRLGKTITAIAAATLRGGARNVVLCPLSNIESWAREIEEWAGEVPTIVRAGEPITGRWAVTNYDVASHHPDWLPGYWDHLICDESVLLKKRVVVKTEVKHQRAKGVLDLRSRSGKVYLLSGSPVARFADDLFAQFHLIYPAAFPSYWRFAHTYCYVDKTQWGEQVVGTRTSINLQQEFSDLMIIRHQEEVYPELPEYIYESIPVKMGDEQQAIYDALLNDFVVQLDTGAEMTVTTQIAQLTRLQECVSTPWNFGDDFPKLSAKIDYVTERVGSGQWLNEPTLLWTNWVRGGKLLAERLREVTNAPVAHIHGGVKDRDTLFEAYKRGDIPFLVLSLGTGKYGHTLSNTRRVVYMEKTYDGDAMLQSLWRARSIGMTHRPVLTTLYCPLTVEELILKNLKQKMRGVSHLTNANLATLLRSLR